MTQILYGNRLGGQGKIRLGCSAVLFDENIEKILLIRRADNGQWCLPSGGVKAGESVSEACEREVLEETGLIVRVKRLVGIYSDPNYLVKYADGNDVQVIALNFEVSRISGEMGLSNETTDKKYFLPVDIEMMELILNHKQRILDTLANQTRAVIR